MFRPVSGRAAVRPGFTLRDRPGDARLANFSQIDVDDWLRRVRRPVRAGHRWCVHAVSADSVSAASPRIVVSTDGRGYRGRSGVPRLPGWSSTAGAA